MKTYRVVVFDWEGTLGDTLGHIVHALADEAKRMDFGEFDASLARPYVTLGLTAASKKLFPHLSLHQQEQLLEAVQLRLSKATGCCLFPGAKAFVAALHAAGIDVAIATNKGPQSLQRVLHESGLEVFFKITRAAGQVPAKPCPQMLYEILDIFDVQASEALMIGDSVVDIDMAVSAGMDAIGFDYYHQQDAELRAAGALAVFDDYEQVGVYLGVV
jgi:phosphoglycolate phosphatase